MSQHIRKKRKILFLDRDDTVIKDYGYLNDPKQVELLPGLISALKIFRDHSYEFIITTNQSGLTRGIVSCKNLLLIHKKIKDLLNSNGVRVLDFYSAPYMHNHKRRKPGAGLTLEAMSDYDVDLEASVFAGDKWRDIIVGHQFGARTVLVNEASNQRCLFESFSPHLTLKNWEQFNEYVFNKLISGEAQNLTDQEFSINTKINFKTSFVHNKNWKNL